MPLALIADLIKAQITSIDVAVEAIQAAAAILATESGTMDTALGTLKDDTALIKAELITLDASVASALNKMVAGCPTGATPFTDVNAAAATTDATGVEVVAAPGAGFKLMVNAVLLSNITPAELAVLNITDEDDNVYLGPVYVGDPAVNGNGNLLLKFPQPIELPENKALEVMPTGTVGDSYMTAFGYTEAV